MTQSVVTRFAPSPTGRLHLGHAWSAMLAHDYARGGRFLLRIEDIDSSRCRPEFVQGIAEDLRWLGLDWDGPMLIQTERSEAHRKALDRLISDGLAYRCWCTRAEIAAAASAPQGEQVPIYPGTCKGRGDPGDSRPHCWRLDVDEAARQVGALSWSDHGTSISAEFREQGDVVIARKDAATSYHIAVTVDDAAQGVTDIVRGRDLFEATHIHRLLQALLELPVPRYHHHPLLCGDGGERLSKRKGAPALADLRAGGMDPVVLLADMRAGRFPLGFALEAA